MYRISVYLEVVAVSHFKFHKRHICVTLNWLYYKNGNWNLQGGWSLVGVPVSDRNLTHEEINAVGK